MNHFQRTFIRGVLIASAWLSIAPPVQGQGDPNPRATSTAAAPPGETLGTVAGIQGAHTGSAFQALLDASTDEKTATAVIGWKDGTSVYALTFKGPLNAKTKESAPISLDGLSNGASVQFAANHLFWSGPDEDEQAEIVQLCNKLPVPCEYENMAPGPDRRRLGELLHLNDIPWYLGFTGGVSVTTYKFLDEVGLKEDSETSTDFSLSTQAGIFRPSLGFLIGTLGYQRTSAAGAESVSLCRPLNGTDATTCANAILKPPTETHGALATFQVRRGLAGSVAIAPTFQHDIKKNVSAVIVPVYFLRDAKGSPIGGVRGGWRSDTNAVAISMFVGAAFSLTP